MRQHPSKQQERGMASMVLVEGGKGNTEWGLICGLYKIPERILSSHVKIQVCLLYIFSPPPQYVFMMLSY